VKLLVLRLSKVDESINESYMKKLHDNSSFSFEIWSGGLLNLWVYGLGYGVLVEVGGSTF